MYQSAKIMSYLDFQIIINSSYKFLTEFPLLLGKYVPTFLHSDIPLLPTLGELLIWMVYIYPSKSRWVGTLAGIWSCQNRINFQLFHHLTNSRGVYKLGQISFSMSRIKKTQIDSEIWEKILSRFFLEILEIDLQKHIFLIFFNLKAMDFWRESLYKYN